ncbi:MAG: hypothetical protein KAW92_05975 [Candidatus Cloacimonetes bacterium]|nr:hypothetical protein [Candidatus Cloacimonadota bacterium]
MKEEIEEQKIVSLCKLNNSLQLDAISEVLKENNIPFSFKRKGLFIGRYFEYSDKKSYIEIMVFRKDKEIAYELIELIMKTLSLE